MTTPQTLRRSFIVGVMTLAVALSFETSASASHPSLPGDVVVVSSTELGSDTFTMTVSNLSNLALDLDLPPPGVVSSVVVDFGSYDGHWTINDLAATGTATMTGVLNREF